MNIFLTIVQFLMAMPKIWDLYKEIMNNVGKKEEIKHDEKVDKLRNAKSEEDIKNATRDLANNP